METIGHIVIGISAVVIIYAVVRMYFIDKKMKSLMDEMERDMREETRRRRERR